MGSRHAAPRPARNRAGGDAGYARGAARLRKYSRRICKRSRGLVCGSVGIILLVEPVRFPESERVVYRKNPLAEVICQVRFPRNLAIEAEPPSAFQKALGSAYPEVRETRAIQLPEELARTVGLDVASLPASSAFDFASKDGAWRVTLTSSYVAVTATQYIRWEEFSEHLSLALRALTESYGIAEYRRLGLRYRDVIRRSTLKLDDAPWSTLLKPVLLAEIVSEDLRIADGEVLHAARELVLRLDSEDDKVRFFHGFAQAALPESPPETCYVIDADFSREKYTERKDADEILDRFHKEAGHLFRWCITDKLHTAMDPVSP